MTSGAPAGWAAEEAKVAVEMHAALQSHLQLATDIEAFAYDLLTGVKSLRHPPVVYKVHGTLLARVLQDLRVTVLATLPGYTMQSWTLAASAFEAAHAMGFIGVDAERATRWLDHTKMEAPAVTTYDGVMATFKWLLSDDTPKERELAVKTEYALYQHLCSAKHANPIAEKTRYWIVTPDSLRLVLTPFLSSRRIREAKLGLAMACRAGVLACWIFAESHAEDFGTIRDRLQDLMMRSEPLIPSSDDEG